MDKRPYTKAIHFGSADCEATGATVTPVYQTATYTQTDVGVTRGFDYSRASNPTRSALEKQLAELESGYASITYASGMSAAHGIAEGLLASGDHVVIGNDVYAGVLRLFTQILNRFGITSSVVDTCSPNQVSLALRPNTRMVWVETPSNPLLRISDIAEIASRLPQSCMLVVDSSFAPPPLQYPLELGAHVVTHSTSKYISGHHDVIGGVAIMRDKSIHQRLAFHQNAVGAVPGPWDAFLTIRGAKTLPLRLRAHERNARAVARFLKKRSDVKQVNYPGLQEHPHYGLAKRQMNGFGGVVSFVPTGGYERARSFVRSTQLFRLAPSLGGVDSLICCPWTMTHGSVASEVKLNQGFGEDLIRLAIGIEDIRDIIDDLKGAFEKSEALFDLQSAEASLA